MGALRIFALLFGVVFVGIGVLGYFPAFVPDGKLLGLFEVDSMHNIVHIVSGLFALWAALSAYYARLYFQIFGLVYGLVALLGFLFMGDLYLMHVNMADNFLHLGIAVVALYLGFFFRRENI